MKRLLLIIIYCLLTICSLVQGANEIRAFSPGVTAAYTVVREADGDVWYIVGDAFEAWGTGARTAADYDIALTDKSGGMFVGSMDINIGAGNYHLVTHYRATGTPLDTDPAIWQEYGYWSGTVWQPYDLKTIEDKIDAVKAETVLILEDTDEIQTDQADGGRLDLIWDAIKAVTDILAAVTTTVSDANDANSFTLTAGLDANDVYLGNTISIQDADDSHWESRMIISWTSARVVVVDEILGFTPAVGDVVVIWYSYYPMRAYWEIPKREPEDPVIIDYRVPMGTPGGTRTLDQTSDDP